MSASVIISFYKQIHWLRLLLAAFERQSLMDFEVLIADDGSPPEIVQQVVEAIKSYRGEARHIWHPDDGFRKTTILNEAIRQSHSTYLIFVDGDCVPHRHFVKDHWESREANVLRAGRRVNLSEQLTQKLTLEKIRSGSLDRPWFTMTLLADSVVGKTDHAEKGIRLTSPLLRRLLTRKMTGVLGCNFSIHLEDMIRINGFDERYHAPAYGEDTDIETRYLWAGGEIKMLRNKGVQYHLYHKKLTDREANRGIYEEVLSRHDPVTPYGLRALDESIHSKDKKEAGGSGPPA